jgi:hypothetical protein
VGAMGIKRDISWLPVRVFGRSAKNQMLTPTSTVITAISMETDEINYKKRQLDLSQDESIQVST